MNAAADITDGVDVSDLFFNSAFKDVEFLSFYLLVVVYLLFFLWYGFVLFTHRKTLNCSDLITGRSGKVDRIALGNLSGTIIASFIPVHMAITGKIDATVFWGCLIYLAGIELFSKYLAHKEGTKSTDSLIK